jgi:hypothetical protein
MKEKSVLFSSLFEISLFLFSSLFEIVSTTVASIFYNIHEAQMVKKNVLQIIVLDRVRPCQVTDTFFVCVRDETRIK